jgi:acyl-CoA reductase-like NAD-dependent aldehyde dehydrogenase
MFSIDRGHIEGAQYWPTVLDRVDRNAALVQEETFGPCAPVIRIRDFEDAIACANQTRFGLQTGVFTRDIGKILDAARRLRVGAVVANGGPQFESPNIPFGGVKKSGFGREGARYAIQEMTTIKIRRQPRGYRARHIQRAHSAGFRPH